MRDYKKIKAFQIVDELVERVYKATKNFPKDEIYGLTSQVRRAALSAAANIVEGSSRQHHKDYLHFLYIARGSLSETGYLIHLSRRLNYLSESQFKPLNELKEQSARILYGLIEAVWKESKLSTKIAARLTSFVA